MRILIADDDPVSCRLLQLILAGWGYQVEIAHNGNQAWQILQGQAAPPLAILDWIMPELDGIELCRRVRQTAELPSVYIILLTGQEGWGNIVKGLQAGADDYLTKPFDAQELQARLQVGARVVQLQVELAQRVKELEATLTQVKQLQGYLPICSYCKNIRTDENYWQCIEDYIAAHSEALFTHSICPDCYQKYAEPELQELRRRRGLT